MHVNVLINLRFNKCTFMFYLQTNEFAQLCCRFADIFSAAPIYISLGINIVSCYCDIAVGGRQSTCAKGRPTAHLHTHSYRSLPNVLLYTVMGVGDKRETQLCCLRVCGRVSELLEQPQGYYFHITFSKASQQHHP